MHGVAVDWVPGSFEPRSGQAAWGCDASECTWWKVRTTNDCSQQCGQSWVAQNSFRHEETLHEETWRQPGVRACKESSKH
jgi:hypothetical protein